MRVYRGVDQLSPQSLQTRKGPFLIRPDKARVARHIGGKNGSELALDF
jgi:hypothetical protein